MLLLKKAQKQEHTVKSITYCQNCGKIVFKSRNPQQHYCGAPCCQKVRKNQWRKGKRVTDVDYKDNQRRANQRWRANHKGYWKRYPSPLKKSDPLLLKKSDPLTAHTVLLDINGSHRI